MSKCRVVNTIRGVDGEYRSQECGQEGKDGLCYYCAKVYAGHTTPSPVTGGENLMSKSLDGVTFFERTEADLIAERSTFDEYL